ncbi:tyrosine-type recombinase/integrase [Flavobacterium sp. CS20]|uniref:tyrosine-type recombinase/integrase n=1 Tax=Flavobacterium sp. CS20 TaxID=2775246 RepID=UPI001B3A328D|nr:tyrosine-type recombinase/integrase [Flavobacterium sp. CS20]QTY27615.1 tyrosine-type recombinase/integrase [Flavobacterium sp. CS20]
MGRPKNIIVVNENYRELAESFYRYILRLGYNAKGRKARKNYLCEFLQWMEQQGYTKIEKTTASQITNYYQYISERPSKKDGGILSQKTTHSHMRIIRDLFIMLQNEGKVKINPCSTLKFPYPQAREERTVLDQEEIKRLYKASETAQERAILSLSYGCGLRVGELVNCNIEDIRLREKIIIIPKGKGNKRRVVPLSNGVAKDLADYYYNEREDLTKGRDYKPNESAFMLHSRGGRMRKGTYNKHLKILVERTENQEIKEKQITIHNLRHSIATHLLEQGIPVEQVRMFLGHSQLETTQIYTHISRKQLENLI